MKNLLKMAVCFFCIITLLCSCTAETPKTDKEKLSIITTIFAPYDFVRQIGGDKVTVKMLLKPGTDAHSYEPSPKDIIKISNCDLFIYTGGENDEWVNELLKNNSNINSLKMLDCVDTIEEEIKDGMTGHADAKHGEADDHVWTSPKNAIKIAEKISEQLCANDPKNAEYYTENTSLYTDELKKIDGEFCEIVKNAKRKTIIFGDRFSARYFVEEYGLNYYAAFPGCSSSVEANPKTIEYLINKINAEKIPAVFYIELSDMRTAKVLSEETNTKTLLFHSAHNVSAEDFKNGITYLDIMKDNEKTLTEALS